MKLGVRLPARRILYAVAAAILYVAPLIYLRWAIREAHFTVVSHARGGEINVIDYGAKADGLSDDGAAFEAAFADAVRHGATVVIPRGTYLVNRELLIGRDMIIRSDGATLKHTDSRISILSAISADGWVLEGPLTLVGTRSGSSEMAGETGLSIASGSHFIVDKLTVMDFRGSGIKITSGKRPKGTRGGRGNHGQFAFVSFIGNNVGLDIESGTGAEYSLFTLSAFAGNDVATRIAAANTVISTSNVVDNANGIELVGDGSNNGHGMFSSVNINHNSGFNIRSADVLDGYTFSGCHIRGDSFSAGRIELTGSSGIDISGSDINAHVFQEKGGMNSITGSFLSGELFAISGTDADKLRCADLFDRDTLASGDFTQGCRP